MANENKNSEPAEDFSVEELLRDLEAMINARQLRLENPYLKDLIEILLPRPNGMSRQMVLHTLERKRKDAGLNIPKNFEQSVQSTYNQYSSDSVVFRRRNLPASEALFYSPRGKGLGPLGRPPE